MSPSITSFGLGILDHGSAAIGMVERHHERFHAVTLNKPARAILGATPFLRIASCLKNPLPIPAVEQMLIEAFQRAFALGRSAIFEYQTASEEGPTFMQVTCDYLGSTGGIDRFLFVSSDISAWKERLAKSEKEFADRSKFFANLMHEIRTPLNGIIGGTDLIRETELSPLQKELVFAVQSSGETLLELVNDFLDVSKIEAGLFRLEGKPFLIHKVIQDVMTNARMMVKNKPLEIRLESSLEGNLQFLGDSLRLKQVLLNLLSNAIKFTASGRITLRIHETHATEGCERLRFEVEDSGIGISPEIQDKLFQPFIQADASTSRKFGGTGLGLSICKHLVEIMGGRIGVESREGRGSTFWFEIVLRKMKSNLPATGEAWRAIAGTFAGKALLVDDSPINQLIVEKILKKFGMEVQTAFDGLEALNRIRRESFDIIFMDCQMPNMDGFETTRRIRGEAHNLNASAPVIALTGSSAALDKERCLAAGMSDYVQKPIRYQDLSRILSEYLPQSNVNTPLNAIS